MIDTIILRIHNIDKYPLIYEQYYNPQKQKGGSTFAFVEKDTGEIKERDFMAAHIFHDSGRVLPFVHRSNNYIASSHYSLSYLLKPEENYIEFNFSIPKYVFSTNVIQFINFYSQSAQITYGELICFIKQFLKDNFLQQPIFNDVEINRIDFCYNQFFNTKDDALRYLDEQKNLLLKYARSSKNRYKTWDTSFMYVTRRYSFKIYHKGTEFAKNDYKKLSKSNPRGLPVQYLQEQADTILRYEMTFKAGMLNYLIQHWFNVSKKAVVYDYLQSHPYPTFCRKLINLGLTKMYISYTKKSKRFNLATLLDETLQYDPKIIIKENAVTFDDTVFTLLYNQFWEKVKQYQLGELLTVDGLKLRLKQYNEDVEQRNKLAGKKKEKKTNQARVILPGLLILKGGSVTELKDYMPERQYYRLTADLRKLGLSDKSHTLALPTPRIDYFDYKLHFGRFH